MLLMLSYSRSLDLITYRSNSKFRSSSTLSSKSLRIFLVENLELKGKQIYIVPRRDN
jgi:hypothetical protein